jgi:TatD DNase family protein
LLVDAHAHLDFQEFTPDLEEVVGRAVSERIGIVIASGIDLKSSRAAAALAAKFGSVHAVAGIHPHEAEKAGPHDLQEIEALLALPKVAGVGEIGLDYHYQLAGREAQMALFRKLLALAQAKDLPVVIHSRAAEAEALSEVRNAGIKRALFHCFTGSVETGRAIIAAGYYIGVTGIITFNNPSNAQLIAQLDPQALVTETDAPFLSPVPKRGKRNEPAYITLVLKKLASLFPEMTEQAMEASVERNIRRIFGLEQVPQGNNP